ncbi:Hypothetical predicted protein [Pelobates cultripes]|uniref:Uncharacterized protein n=1 Tax=Pelobates cultripes TaxID=61616 RepID=A0AAD1RWU7_PELCU|nr:Hypothetical predicted protein [Pelobates cultripes]
MFWQKVGFSDQKSIITGAESDSRDKQSHGLRAPKEKREKRGKTCDGHPQITTKVHYSPSEQHGTKKIKTPTEKHSPGLTIGDMWKQACGACGTNMVAIHGGCSDFSDDPSRDEYLPATKAGRPPQLPAPTQTPLQ